MISLSPVQSLLACCLVLAIGRVLTTRIGVLARYSIPDPIVGGLLFAIGAYALSTWGGPMPFPWKPASNRPCCCCSSVASA